MTVKIPAGDNMPRHVCESCDAIHYLNPKIIVGCLPVWEDSVLLCKRAIEPRLGKWTMPSGFMELEEDVKEGAARETAEEANAEVEALRIHTIYSLPQVGQVYLIFLAKLKNLNFSPGEESLEVKLFKAAEIPWDEIAFSSVRFCLNKYFEDPQMSSGSPHIGVYTKKK